MAAPPHNYRVLGAELREFLKEVLGLAEPAPPRDATLTLVVSQPERKSQYGAATTDGSKVHGVPEQHHG